MVGCWFLLTLFNGALLRIEEDEALPGNPRLYSDCLWAAWIYMTDPGTHADISETIPRLIAGFVSAAGIIYFATVLGFLGVRVAVASTSP